MSTVSGGSSGSSNVRQRGFVVGVPKRCWCGEHIVAKNSKSEPNPSRRYFRCREAAAKKLVNDNHIFKWVDEALLDEVATLGVQFERVKEEMKERTIVTLQEQKLKFEKMQMEFEKELCERVEEVLLEAKAELQCRMNKSIIVCVFGFMILFALFKLV